MLSKIIFSEGSRASYGRSPSAGRDQSIKTVKIYEPVFHGTRIDSKKLFLKPEIDAPYLAETKFSDGHGHTNKEG